MYSNSSLRLYLIGGVNLREWILRNLNEVDDKVVWINWYMVTFEEIWKKCVWKFENDLINVIDFLSF